MSASREAIIGAVRACDYFRRSPGRIGGPRGHKEWLHFCISSGSVDLLINVSIVDDLRHDVHEHRELARLSVLWHDEGWEGAIQLYPSDEVRVVGGEIDATIGPNRIYFEDGVIVLRVRLPRPAIEVDLRLSPVTLPYLVSNIRGLDGRPINWAVVPRSRAEGVLRLNGRTIEVTGALAYHDHNWGSFGWGNNFAWEWGYGLPADASNPWTVVFARLNSRGNTAALMQLFYLWRADRMLRTFRDHEIEVRREGLLRPDRMLKLPPAMGLVAPGLATDIPERLSIRAASRGDVIEAVFETENVAQVIIPNDDDLGVTIINEVSGRLTMDGSAFGEPVHLDHRAVFEFLSA
ncbi:MAG: hypothetical protein QM820_45710 [Minicystis sp.]